MAAQREWFEKDQRRKELESEARQIDAECDIHHKDLLVAMEEAGRVEITRGPYRASVVDGSASVSWKAEFLRVAGGEAATELTKAAKEHPPKKINLCKIG